MKILNIQAHPDDAECYCGGTLAKYADRGDEIFYLICTKGNRGTYDRSLDLEKLAEIRRKETAESARVLGVKEVFFLNGEDAFLYPTLDLRGNIMRLIRKVQPDLVMTLDPFLPYEIHPDHRTVGMLTAEAVVFAGFPHFYPEHLREGIEPHFVKELYFYRTKEPNYFEDITSYLERKKMACYCHRSQVIMAGTQRKETTGESGTVEELGKKSFDELAIKISEEYGKQVGVKYAEGFKKFRVRAGHLVLE
ncbi:MAG TPA: PIG-L family deacetylase [bacterium]|nr:PIG-L family deacetylase [bacterium]HOL66670.1 PIG-L family deacetylase [bacterium]HPP11973.1 PIG-L family deacetylase [bacterium]